MLLARQERLRSNRQQEAESTAADVLARKQKISATTAGSYGKKVRLPTHTISQQKSLSTLQIPKKCDVLRRGGGVMRLSGLAGDIDTIAAI